MVVLIGLLLVLLDEDGEFTFRLIGSVYSVLILVAAAGLCCWCFVVDLCLLLVDGLFLWPVLVVAM